MRERACIIIPALNEAPRITPVIEAALAADGELIDTAQIIVVDNGSADETIQVASQLTQHVLQCAERGKGHAMHIGVEYAKRAGARVITFLDADQIGLRPDHINRLSKPVVEGRLAMNIGIMGGRAWLGRTSIVGAFSGQRSLSVNVWDKLLPDDLEGWRIEGALNAVLRNARPRQEPGFVYLDGVSQFNKFAKGRPALRSSIEYVSMAGSMVHGLWSRSNL